ncbi:MAG: ABC-2 family transporter protein [Opitutaceae bacterium]
MKPFFAIISARFRLLLQYRAAAVAGLITQIIFGLIITMVFQAFYRSGDLKNPPMTLAEVVTYVWLGQALLGILPWNGDPEIRALVRSGGVAYETLRPVNLYVYWFARAIALRTAPTLLRAVPMVILALTFFGMRPPESLPAGCGFLLVMVGTIALSCAITVLVGISLMWTISGEGQIQLLPAVVTLFSGMLVPIPLFPEWARPIVEWLPFKGLVDAPYRVYLGHIPLEDIGGVILHQWIWVGLLVIGGTALMHRGLRKLTIQGG